MDKTKIDWCDSTWNPVTGCYHGCEYCYARGIASRFGGFMGTDGENIKVIGEKDWGICFEVAYKTISPYPKKFAPTLHRYRLSDYEKKAGRNIFVCSMADLFGAWVPDSWIEEVFAACEKAPQHNYLFLTKNPERYERIDSVGTLPASKNMWYGSTLTRPEDKCFVSNAHNTFWSIEPIHASFRLWERDEFSPKWIIIGAETGRRKNRVIPQKEWIEDIVEWCDKSNIPVFMKSSLAEIWGEPLIQEFPEGLRKGR